MESRRIQMAPHGADMDFSCCSVKTSFVRKTGEKIHDLQACMHAAQWEPHIQQGSALMSMPIRVFISLLDSLFHGYPWKIPVLHVIPSCTGQSPLSGGITWHTFFFSFSCFQNKIESEFTL